MKRAILSYYVVRSLSKWKEELKRVRHDEFRESYIKKTFMNMKRKLTG